MNEDIKKEIREIYNFLEKKKHDSVVYSMLRNSISKIDSSYYHKELLFLTLEAFKRELYFFHNNQYPLEINNEGEIIE